jgi:RHS repeat-associated protein
MLENLRRSNHFIPFFSVKDRGGIASHNVCGPRQAQHLSKTSMLSKMAEGVRRISRHFIFFFLFCALLSPARLPAQHFICIDVCSTPTPTPTPPPTASPTPSATPVPTPPPLAPGPRQSFLGTEDFAYAVPLFSLPGRHGLDLNLTLYYSSTNWTGPDSQGYVWPAQNWDINPGFRLGFGTLQLRSGLGGPAFIEPSGAIHPLKDTSGNGTAFISTDSTYFQVQHDLNTGNSVVIYKNGLQAFYPNSSAVPAMIEDATGNFIAINYACSGCTDVTSVVDTVGRTLNLIYGTAGAAGALACITDGSSCTALGAHTYTFNWTPYTLHYNFAKYLAQGIVQNGNSYLVVSSVTRPDGTKVQFNYGDWGIVTDIQEFSNNGSLRYETSYNFPLAISGTLIGPPVYTQKTVTSFDAQGNRQQGIWSYQEATANPTPGKNVVTCFAVTDPAGTINLTSFSAAGNGFDGVPVQSIVATGSTAACSTPPSTILRTVNTQWTSDQDSSGNFSGINARPSNITSILEDGRTQSQTQFVAYDAHGNTIDVKESDFGAGSPGPLLRETVIAYASNTGSIFNLPSDVQIKDGGGTVLSHQTFNYDDYSKTSLQGISPLPPGFDSANPIFASGSTRPRGNLTGSTVYANAATGTGAISSTFAYDMLGNQLSAKSGCCTQIGSSYSATTQYAYPDSIAIGPSGNQLTTIFTYDMSNGRPATSIDPNGQKTQTIYDVDARPANSTSPEGIKTTFTYDDASANPGVSVITTANSRATKSIVDFLGRPLTRQVLNGGTVVSTISYVNDLLGRPSHISNPYGPADTPQYTNLTYEALSRQTLVTPPAAAGNNQNLPYQTQYATVTYTDAAGISHSGTSVQTIDPAGQPRLLYFDVLGRLVRVDEPTGGSAATAGTGSATVNGGEKSIQVLGSPGTAGTGNVQVSGSVQWKTVANATTAGTTNITIGGTEQQNPTGITPGTGSVTIGGAEQSIVSTPAMGAVTFTGTLQSTQVQTQAAKAGIASITIGGSEQSQIVTTTGPPCRTDVDGVTTCTTRTTTRFDSGTVTFTINGHADAYTFGANDTTATIASSLAANINGDAGAFVNASASGATVFLTSRTTGSATNYSLTSSVSESMGSFGATPTGAALAGGQAAVNTTIYDSSSCTITANGHGDSSSWSGSATTPAGIATALATAINADSLASVNASASGNIVNLTTRSTGTISNYSLSPSCGYDPGHFSVPSFTASSSSSLTGGKNAIFDGGTVSITLNSHVNSVSFNSSSTPATIASALAANINADTGAFAIATASNATMAITAKTKGTLSNYSMSSGGTYDTTDFTKSSFTTTPSGATLSGGSPNNSALDSGTMTVTVNTKPYTVNWGANSNAASIALALATALGPDLAITPTLSGSAILLNPKTQGTQYTFSTGFTYDSADFSHSSFATTNSVSDYGTSAITANGHTDSVPWSGGSTPTTVAASLAAQISGDATAAVSATASGSTVSLNARTTGVASNYNLTSSNAYDTAHFTGSSFATTNSGATLSGGVNPLYNTIFDSGAVSLTVNGTSYTVNYGQNDTVASIENALATKINAGGIVNVAVSGGSLILTSDSRGIATNYSLAASSASSQPSLFSSPSFTGVGSGSTLTGAADAVGGNLASPLVTFYSYDALGNLLRVNQGQQTRTYLYDSLRRLTSSCIPEAANACTNFNYTDFGAVKTKIDPRQVTSTFGFDSWNHVNDITYSDGVTPEATFTYGGPAAPNNGAGRLVSSSYGTVSKSYQYDVAGRINQMTETLGGNTYTTKNGYSNGQLSSIVYPSASAATTGTQANYNYDAIGRLSSVTVGGTTVFSVNSYSAAEAPLTTSFGNGMTGTYGYNNQLQLSSIQYGSANAQLMNLAYNYGGTFDNGKIQQIVDNLVPSRSTSYVYDALGRLQQAQTLDQASPNTWNLKFSYDRYGNRQSETPNGGTASMPNSQLLVDPATNHITTSGFAYDATGNMTSDSGFNYRFDAANRITAVSSPGTTTPFANYAYDDAGLRANKNGNFYIFSGGQVLAEYANGATAASPNAEYIYAGGQRVATLTTGALTYHYWDHLSDRVSADANGNVVHTYGSFPFGETWYESGANKWKFTTYENDSESGLNYADARFHSPAQGRFMSVDPLSGSLDAPQSLNRYAYVTDDPVNLADPSGLVQVYVPGNPGGVLWGFDIFDALIGGGVGLSPVKFDMFGNLMWDFQPPSPFKYFVTVTLNGSQVYQHTFNNFDLYADWLTSASAAGFDFSNCGDVLNCNFPDPDWMVGALLSTVPQAGPQTSSIAVDAQSKSLNICGDIAANGLNNSTQLIMRNFSIVNLPTANGTDVTKIIGKAYTLVPGLNKTPILGCHF